MGLGWIGFGGRENGIKVIPGSCPNQFLNPDFGHRIMRVLWRTLGFMKVS